MHKCKYKGCNAKVKDQYRYCYKHKNTIYYGTCKIHGRTKFKYNACLRCRAAKVPVYRIYKKGKKYYKITMKRALPKNFWLKPWYKILTKKTKRYQNTFIKRVTAGPGTYGIFVRNNKNKLGIGKCLYVGQSTNVKRRVNEHKQNIALARKKSQKKTNLPNLYYKIAKYDQSALKIVKLHTVDKRYWSKLNKKQAKELLAYLEQVGMDVYKPKFNIVAARCSKF